MGKKVQEVYGDVMAAEKVDKKSITQLFIWYELLSFSLSFQLLFILAYSIGISYAATMLCAICIIVMDVSLKKCLEKEPKNFSRLQKQMPLVKLWTIPLIVMAIATSGALIAVTFGLI